MRRITLAMVGWTTVWVAAVWAIDPAATVGGKPPSWAIFELWALGFILLGAVSAGLLAVGASGAVRVDPRRLRSVGGAALAWTAVWMVLLVVWALDPRATDIGSGPGAYAPVNLKSSEPVLYAIWATGLLLLGAAWLVARARIGGRAPRSPRQG